LEIGKFQNSPVNIGNSRIHQFNWLKLEFPRFTGEFWNLPSKLDNPGNLQARHDIQDIVIACGHYHAQRRTRIITGRHTHTTRTLSIWARRASTSRRGDPLEPLLREAAAVVSATAEEAVAFTVTSEVVVVYGAGLHNWGPTEATRRRCLYYEDVHGGNSH
jgi:hypothetical protein